MIVYLLSFFFNNVFVGVLGYCIHYNDVLKDSSHIHVFLVKDIANNIIVDS